MKTPHKIENANGSPNAGGSLQYYTDFKVATGEAVHPLCFYIMDIGLDNLILGYPWFTATNITLDWKNGTIPVTITICTLGAASGKPRRTARVATTTTINYNGTYQTPKRPMAHLLPNHPALTRLAKTDARERLAVDQHSTHCRFLFANGDRHGKPNDATPQPTVQLPQSTFLTTHRNC